VITRSRNSIHDIYELNSNIWYIVHTNYDRNKQDPKKDYRRIPAQLKMDKIGVKQATEQNVMNNVFSTFPNFN
jgi:hypothetical protein